MSMHIQFILATGMAPGSLGLSSPLPCGQQTITVLCDFMSHVLLNSNHDLQCHVNVGKVVTLTMNNDQQEGEEDERSLLIRP